MKEKMISETIDKRCFLYTFIRIDMAIGILFVYVVVVTGLSKSNFAQTSDHYSQQEKYANSAKQILKCRLFLLLSL